MSKQQSYYAFRRPNAMVEHKFTDDVAICKAINFRQAKKIFSKYYADIEDDEIIRITGNLNSSNFLVITDY